MDFSSIFSSLVSSTAGFSTTSCFFSGLAVLAGQQERRARDVGQSNRVLPLWSLGVQTAGAWDHLSSGALLCGSILGALGLPLALSSLGLCPARLCLALS